MKSKQLLQYIYYGYGLNILSTIELPLPKSNIACNFDVNITIDKIPEHIECDRKISSYSISPDSFILNFKDIKIFVGHGKEIIIESDGNEDINENDIIPFILSSCIGALLHQRSILTLHASSVMTEKGAVIFIGNASSGKSTLAAALRNGSEQIYNILSDDICPIDIINGKAVMYPSGEKLQIWKDIISTTKIPKEALAKVRPSIEKYYYKQTDHIVTGPVKIANIYLLNSSNKSLYEINSKFSTNQKLNILKNNIYCKNFAKEMFIESQYYKKLKQLAQTLPIKEFIKPNNEFDVEKLIDVLEKDCLTANGR